jgi:hypothetical protein
MRLNVIADRRRGYEAAFQAKPTKRVLEELVLPDPRPTRGAIPATPFHPATAHGAPYHPESANSPATR